MDDLSSIPLPVINIFLITKSILFCRYSEAYYFVFLCLEKTFLFTDVTNVTSLPCAHKSYKVSALYIACTRFDLLYISVTGCLSSTAELIVKSKCHGRRSCIVYANEATFGNLCPNIGKYLKISYVCGEWGKGNGEHCLATFVSFPHV